MICFKPSVNGGGCARAFKHTLAPLHTLCTPLIFDLFSVPCVRCKANYQSLALRYNLPQKKCPADLSLSLVYADESMYTGARSHTQQVRCVTVFELYYVFCLVWCLPNITAPYVVQNIWKKREELLPSQTKRVEAARRAQAVSLCSFLW
jgi:hypothetical protein